MHQPTAPIIFSPKARAAKLARARRRWRDHAFIHERAAADIVDRLESILKRFEQVAAEGPGASLLADAMTQAADVGSLTINDPLAEKDAPFSQDLDALISFMNLHTENDPLAALRAARDQLKPDGLFLCIFPGERTLNELRDTLQTAEAAVTGRVAPRVAPMIAVKDAGALLQRAGFALPVADIVSLPIEYQSLARLFSDLRYTGETNALVKSPKGALRREVLSRVEHHYKKRHTGPDGGLAVTCDLVVLTGWAPHPSQPKPLKPGSATASLRDAIQDQNPNKDKTS